MTKISLACWQVALCEFGLLLQDFIGRHVRPSAAVALFILCGQERQTLADFDVRCARWWRSSGYETFLASAQLFTRLSLSVDVDRNRLLELDESQCKQELRALTRFFNAGVKWVCTSHESGGQRVDCPHGRRGGVRRNSKLVNGTAFMWTRAHVRLQERSGCRGQRSGRGVDLCL